eukprot:UN09652
MTLVNERRIIEGNLLFGQFKRGEPRFLPLVIMITIGGKCGSTPRLKNTPSQLSINSPHLNKVGYD